MLDLITATFAFSLILLTLQSKVLLVLHNINHLIDLYTTPVWRVETLYAVLVKVLISASTVFVLMRMLRVLVRLCMGEVNDGGRAVMNRQKQKAVVYVYQKVRFCNDTTTTPCIVCLCEGSNNAVLECWHSFHWDCVCPWLDQHNTCPLCKCRQSRRGLDAMGQLVVDVVI
jgi:hypothetical protein